MLKPGPRNALEGSTEKAAPRCTRGAAFINAEMEGALALTTLGSIFTLDRFVRLVIEVAAAAFLVAVEVAVDVVSGVLAAEGHFAIAFPGED